MMNDGVMNVALRVLAAGLLGGFTGNAVLGLLFTSPPVHTLLYDPALQSAQFIEITSQRNIPLSVAGLVLLSSLHGWLFYVLRSALPGASWLGKGLFWGLVIWAMYWLFQEWFIYHTLLNEPWLLNALELAILLIGSLAEGLVIASILTGYRPAPAKESQAQTGQP